MSNTIPYNSFKNKDMFQSGAVAPGQLTLSDQKLRMMRPDLYGIGGYWQRFISKLGIGFCQRMFVMNQLMTGDCRAAMVISLNPLLVAAFTDEIDCIAMLEFPDLIIPTYQLQIGTRLLTVNFYTDAFQMQSDLIPGQDNKKRWQMFFPLVADFVSGDYEKIRQHKARINEEEWQKTYYLGLEYRQHKPGLVRFGLPVICGLEAPPPAPHEATRSIYQRNH